jgi:hypothetical protein
MDEKMSTGILFCILWCAAEPALAQPLILYRAVEHALQHNFWEK